MSSLSLCITCVTILCPFMRLLCPHSQLSLNLELLPGCALGTYAWRHLTTHMAYPVHKLVAYSRCHSYTPNAPNTRGGPREITCTRRVGWGEDCSFELENMSQQIQGVHRLRGGGSGATKMISTVDTRLRTSASPNVIASADSPPHCLLPLLKDTHEHQSRSMRAQIH